MAQFARPDADVSAGSWTPNPAAPGTLYDKIDETSPDDTDYIIALSNTTCEINLSDVTDPVSNDGHIIRWRGKMGLLSAGVSIEVRLFQGAVQKATTGAVAQDFVFTTREYTLSAIEASGITDYTDLRIKVISTGTDAPFDEADVSWAEFEVPTPTDFTTLVQSGAFKQSSFTTIAQSGAFKESAFATLIQSGAIISRTSSSFTALAQSGSLVNQPVVELPSEGYMVNSRILIQGREIPEATPTRLWRKNKQAATLNFKLPRRTYLSLMDQGLYFRQGETIELWYGYGTSQQRIFYGSLPSEGLERRIDNSARELEFTATDFLAQLRAHNLTLAQENYPTPIATDSLYDTRTLSVNPVGQEIGGFIATLVQRVIDHQFGSTEFTIQGIKGTNPPQFITPENVITGTGDIKSFVDKYTDLAFIDDTYPDTPILYEYHQRDHYFVWRRQLMTTATANISLAPRTAYTFVIGKDAVISGEIRRQPIYTDANATGKTLDARWNFGDRDANRRWGGKRFVASVSTSSSFQADAYALAVRTVESAKHERLSFSLTTLRDAFLLYPGDIVRVEGGDDVGIPTAFYRAEEITSILTPATKTTITLGVTETRLTDYL